MRSTTGLDRNLFAVQVQHRPANERNTKCGVSRLLAQIFLAEWVSAPGFSATQVKLSHISHSSQ
jgi:hypothetical protein